MSELFTERTVGPGLSLFPTFGTSSQPVRSNVKRAPRELRFVTGLFVWAAVWLLIYAVSSLHNQAVATRSDSVVCKRH